MPKIQHVDDPKEVGRRIAMLRDKRGLSQRDLASPGCSYAYISRLEAGKRTPSGQALDHLAARLGTTAKYLATGQLEPWQDGLADAGLEISQLDEQERAVLERSLGDAARHAARIVGESIIELRVETARTFFRAGHTAEEAAEKAGAPLQALWDKLEADDHDKHDHAFDETTAAAVRGGN